MDKVYFIIHKVASKGAVWNYSTVMWKIQFLYSYMQIIVVLGVKFLIVTTVTIDFN